MLPKDFSTNVLIPAIVWLVCSVLITVGFMSQIEDGRFTTLLFIVICGAIFAVPMIIYLNCRTIINDYFDGKKRKQTKERETLPVDVPLAEAASPIEKAGKQPEPTAIINNVVVQVANSSTNVAYTEAHAESESTANSTTTIEKDNTSTEPVAEDNEATIQTAADWPTLFADNKAIILFDGLVKENLLAEGYKKKDSTEATQLAYMLGTIYEILNINPRWKEFESFWNVKNLRQTFNQTFNRGSVVKNQYAIKLAIQKAADSNAAIKNMDKYIKWRKENAVD